MNVVSVTPWYDESPANLVRVARSLMGLVDATVWVDGAYDHFPNAADRSPYDQYEAITQGCMEAGLDCLIYTPKEVGRWGRWHHGGEVPKRNFTLTLAATMCPDWLMIVDADWEFCGDALAVRESLEGCPLDVRAADGWVVGWGETRTAYRWDPKMSYSMSHYYVRAGDGETLWCPVRDDHRQAYGIAKQVDGLDLMETMVFDHLPRPDGFRDAAARAYYALRDDRGIEDLYHREISTGETA